MKRNVVTSMMAAIVLGVVTMALAVGAGAMTGPSEHFDVEQGAWSVMSGKSPLGGFVLARIEREAVSKVPAIATDSRLPWWRDTLPRPELDADHEAYSLTTWAVGWPFTAGVGELELYSFPDGSVDAESSVDVFWLALVAGIALHSFAWLTLIRAPGAIRWVRRRRRGQCPVCTYDLRGTPGETCSECGADLRALARRAQLARRGYVIAAIVVLTVTAVPAAQAWQRTTEERAAFAQGAWLDRIIDGEMNWRHERYEAFINRVQAIPAHHETIANRWPDLDDDAAQNVASFVTSLVSTDPREDYLPLLKQSVELTAPGEPPMALLACGLYPWSASGEIISASFDNRGEEHLNVAGVAVTAISHSWRDHPEPEHRDEVESLLRRVMELNGTRPALRALHTLAEWGWIDSAEARDRLEVIVESNRELRDDRHYRRTLELLDQIDDAG